VNAWTTRELQVLNETLELRATIPRPDGGMHGPVILWHGVVGDDVFVRSARGARAAWFCCAVAAGVGVLDVDGATSTVRFEVAPADAVPAALDEVLHRRYDMFAPSPVAALTSSHAKDATLLVTPLRSADLNELLRWQRDERVDGSR